MNGTLFSEIQRKKYFLKKEKIKFFFALVSTNIFVCFLCFSFQSAEPNPQKDIIKKIIHPHYKMITASIDLLCEYNENQAESVVRLTKKNHQIIAQKAYLHGPITSDSKKFKIEINEEDLLNLKLDPNDSIIAMPELKTSNSKRFTTKQRISKYEISL
jgi:hypothetical protein